MYGQHIGTLNVLTAVNGSRSAPIWTLSGYQGPYWRPARVTIRSSVKHNVSINKLIFMISTLSFSVSIRQIFLIFLGAIKLRD